MRGLNGQWMGSIPRAVRLPVARRKRLRNSVYVRAALRGVSVTAPNQLVIPPTMTRKYQPKLLADGTANPRHKADQRKGSRHVGRVKSGFVGWDGEGVDDDDGRHHYVLLANSTGLIETDRAGIPSSRCFDLLIESWQQHRDNYHVGFAFGYDVNMMLRDVDIDSLRRLWNTGNCEWNGYKLHYKNRREFRVKKGKGSAQIWDVWGFFQSSFVAALALYGRHEAAARIKKLKDQRDVFEWSRIDEIIEYCLDECRELAAMMDQFAAYLDIAGISIRRYDGAGAVAGAMMKQFGVAEYKRKTEWARTRNGTPVALRAAAMAAYFGGRIELLQFGHAVGLFHEYDLRSAYPSIMQHVPCLRCGTWTRVDGDGRGDASFTVYHVRWKLHRRDTACPFPWRDFDGAIYFPHKGIGWYWRPEVDAAFEALAHGVIHGTIEILERWEYCTRCQHRPFGWIPDVYLTRQKWVREGNGAQLILKLGCNALYGKTAQRTGGRGGAPPWHQLEWAGYVVSGARAAVYRAAFPAIKVGALLSFNTDAVFTTIELPDLNVGDALGAWDHSTSDVFTAVQSGVYWFGSAASKMRGFPKNEKDADGQPLLNPTVVRNGWREGVKKLHFHMRRFLGLGRALTGPNQFAQWRTWPDQPKSLSLTPLGTKRTLMGVRGNVDPSKGLVLTLPEDPHIDGVTESAPIKLPWVNRGRSGGESTSRRETRRANAEEDSADD